MQQYMIYGIAALVVAVFILAVKLRTADAEIGALRKALRRKEEDVRSLAADADTNRRDMKRSYDENVSGLRKSIEDYKNANLVLQKDVAALQETQRTHKENLEKLLASNLTSIPWLAGMMADFLTYDIEVEAAKLCWGYNVQRQKKVASLMEIRRDTKARIEEAKVATYQLEYLRQLFPEIDEILATDYKELDYTGHIGDGDPVRRYLSPDEWRSLSESERNQLALDRYVASRQKSRWQIGRDYELAVAHEYRKKGYSVDTTGSYKKYDDLGRDLIAKRDGTTLIIQCKYWSEDRTIHEKHIFQLYGTMICYCLENRVDYGSVKGVFVTKTTLSPMAQKVAAYLGIYVSELHPMSDFPRIKCNLGRDENGATTRIYHLPMDDLYDRTKIETPGEFYAFTVKEAEAAGFRRAYKWHGE